MSSYEDMQFSAVLTKMADDIRSHMILQHSSHADAAALWAVATYRTRDANVYITNELEELFKRYLPPKTDN